MIQKMVSMVSGSSSGKGMILRHVGREISTFSIAMTKHGIEDDGHSTEKERMGF